MSNENLVQKNPIRAMFDRDDVKAKFKELLGKKSTAFCTSILQIVSSNALLQKADPNSIYQAAMIAATLDLPINSQLGFAYIIPYNTKQQDGTFKVMAQFQIGAKGFRQLALRSGQFKSINSSPIYQGQLINNDQLNGLEFDFSVVSDELIGYAAKFVLINGFESTLYMTVEQLKKHGAKYSKTFTQKYGLWNTDFDAMARKTVIKLLLSRDAPLSIDNIITAISADQAVINDAEKNDFTYVDHEEVVIDKEAERIALMINDCKTIEELMKLQPHIKEAQQELYEMKFSELSENEI